MSPEYWGKPAWDFLHSVTLGYPENPTPEDKQNYYTFFMSLQNVLPCGKCRRGLTQHIQQYPLTDQALSTRNNLIQWLIDIHNIVNYYNGKPVLSYEEAMTEINNIGKSEDNDDCNIWYIISIALAIIIILLLIYCCYKKKN